MTVGFSFILYNKLTFGKRLLSALCLVILIFTLFTLQLDLFREFLSPVFLSRASLVCFRWLTITWTTCACFIVFHFFLQLIKIFLNLFSWFLFSIQPVVQIYTVLSVLFQLVVQVLHSLLHFCDVRFQIFYLLFLLQEIQFLLEFLQNAQLQSLFAITSLLTLSSDTPALFQCKTFLHLAQWTPLTNFLSHFLQSSILSDEFLTKISLTPSQITLSSISWWLSSWLLTLSASIAMAAPSSSLRECGTIMADAISGWVSPSMMFYWFLIKLFS